MLFFEEFPESTSIEYVKYDDEAETSEVCFRKSGVYIYYEMPILTFKKLLLADSHGRFVAKEVSKYYKYKKVAR